MKDKSRHMISAILLIIVIINTLVVWLKEGFFTNSFSIILVVGALLMHYKTKKH